MGIFEAVTAEVEQLFQDFGKAIEEAAEEIGETIETVAEDVQDSLVPGVDQYFYEIFEPFVDFYTEFEDVVFEDLADDAFINPKVEPTSTNNPACVGCQHYHGRIYSGTLLVCGMHPYGWDGEECPDWEEKPASSLFDELF